MEGRAVPVFLRPQQYPSARLHRDARLLQGLPIHAKQIVPSFNLLGVLLTISPDASKEGGDVFDLAYSNYPSVSSIVKSIPCVPNGAGICRVVAKHRESSD